MTRKSFGRIARDKKGIPKKNKIAKIVIDHERKTQFILTNDMLVNQLKRDGPRVAKSFDQLAKREIEECSKLVASVHGKLLRHLPSVDDEQFKPTAARLLSSAANSFVASIEVARHGFPRQYGSLARMVVETLATVLALATNPNALEQFHSGKLQSTKCVPWAKKTLPILPKLWGMLSNEFVHIGQAHANLEMPKKFSAEDEALGFILPSMLTVAWLLLVVTELIYADEGGELMYWKRVGEGWSFEPTPAADKWMKDHLI